MGRSLKSLAHLIPEGERWEMLSARQREVFLLIARGYSSQDVVEKLGRAHSAVTTHKRRAFAWLCLSCNADATAYALKYKLIEGTLGVKVECRDP